MSGIWILLLLILAAALPVIIAFFWYRAKKSAVTLPWFLAALTAGISSLFIAALIQRFFSPGKEGLWPVFFGLFIRISFVEEASRLVTLILLFIAGSRRRNISAAFGAALGLASGLGFAMIENAFIGMADINITLMRAFTAAPLHGACGIRAGSAVFTFPKSKSNSLFYFISAVLIHGAYNLIIINPALPSPLSILVAFAALFSSLPLINTPDKDDENSFKQTNPLP